MHSHPTPHRTKKPTWLFAVPWDPWDERSIGGVSVVVNELVRLAVTDRFAPIVLVPDYDSVRPNAARRHRAALVQARIVTPPVERASLRQLVAAAVLWPISLWRLCGLLVRLRPKGVNVHYPGLWCLTLLLALRITNSRARLVLSFHGADVHAIETAPLAPRFWWRVLVRRADAITCCSDDLAARLRTALGRPERLVETVHNGIDFERLRRQLAAACPSGTRLPDRFVLCVATFEAKKGQDVLVRAFARLRHRMPDLALVLVGRSGPTLASLRSLAAELDLGDAVRFEVGLPHADTLAVTQRAELFVLSSRQEPFGIVLLEAACLEIPIVATAVGGVPEVVRHDYSALLVPRDDVDALANAMLRVLTDAALRDRLRSNARRTALEQFTWRAAYERYRRIVMADRLAAHGA